MTDFPAWGRALTIMVGSSAVVTIGAAVGGFSISRAIIRAMRKA